MPLPELTEAFEADINAVADECISELVCKGVTIRGMKGEASSGGSFEMRGLLPETGLQFVAAASLFTGGLPSTGSILTVDGTAWQVSAVKTSPDNAQVTIDLERPGA